jgi:hypothetical protein
MRSVGAFLSVVLLNPGLVGCGAEAPELDPQVGDEVATVAEPAAAELLRTLVGRLTAALEEGGAVHAIRFCSDEALPLTLSIQSGFPGDLTLKRTSFRYRNPLNAPDEAEEEALLYFEEAVLAAESPPSSFVQKVSGEEYRYYQPLFLGEFCLQCHGDPEAMAPDVKEALALKYPGDLAVGYEAGDFRGVLRVSVPASELSRPGEG